MKKDEFEDDFQILLDLYLKGRLSATQKAQLERQLDAFNKNDEPPHEFTEPHIDEMWKRIDAKTSRHVSPRRVNWIAIAAAVILTGGAVLFTLSWNKRSSQSSDKLILADGSIVWLKNGATLDYSNLSPENREVTLSGEALFEVAKDREHPFIIQCGRYFARVLGTSFNIKATDSAVELTVLTGQVRISSLTGDSSVVVQPHEHVVFTEFKGVVLKTDPGSEGLKAVTKNTEYNMHFEDTRMDEIVLRIEGKFNVKIDLEDSDLRNCMISADFTDQSLTTTLTMISEALGIRYDIDDRKIVIRGVGCKE